MLHKKTYAKIQMAEKVMQQIMTAKNPTAKCQKLRGRKRVIENSNSENPT